MFSAQLELLPWVQKGDKNFYNESLAGVNLDLLPHPPQKIVVFGERVIEVPLFAYENKKYPLAARPLARCGTHRVGTCASRQSGTP